MVGLYVGHGHVRGCADLAGCHGFDAYLLCGRRNPGTLDAGTSAERHVRDGGRRSGFARWADPRAVQHAAYLHAEPEHDVVCRSATDIGWLGCGDLSEPGAMDGERHGEELRLRPAALQSVHRSGSGAASGDLATDGRAGGGHQTGLQDRQSWRGVWESVSIPGV